MHRFLLYVVPLMCLGLTLVPSSTVLAQKPPAPIKPNPLAPVLNLPTPLGMQRDGVIELTLTGTNLAEPTGLYTSFPAQVTIPTDNKNGQDNTKLRVQLKVPADAPLGYHYIALATTRGMSNFRVFCIDDLPQVLKDEKAKVKAAAQTLTLPCVVAGRIDTESSDWYKIKVGAGQRVCFDVLGRRLGSDIDPQLSIYHAGTNRELAHANDSPGCQTDPRLSHVFKEGGEYLIEVKDTLYRGGATYGYRLRVGDFPVALAPLPLAAKRGSKVSVRFAGPYVEGVAAIDVSVPTDPNQALFWVAPKGANGLHGWPVALMLSDQAEGVEQEPNNEAAKANRLTVPGGVTGQFQKSADADFYVFKAKKGEKLLIEAHTLELYTPTLVYMVLRNAKGAEVGKTNPQANPPLDQRIDFTATEDGDYVLEVQHLNYEGGPNEVYRITIASSEPDFEFTLGIDRYDVAGGGSLALPLVVTRRGYSGPIDVRVVGHPSITGQVTIKANEPTKPGLVGATLQLIVGRDVPIGPHIITLEANGEAGGKKLMQLVNLRPAVMQNLGGLSYPPRQFNTMIGLAVKEGPPFGLTATFEGAVAPGLSTTLTIKAHRDPGFDEEITLTALTGLPKGVTAPPLKSLAKGQSELKVEVRLPEKVPVANYPITVSGKAKHKNKDVVVSAAPAMLEVALPFELKVTPTPLPLVPGGKAKLKITATRKGGFDGPINVEVRNLPANVTADKGTIAMGQTTIELEVSAAATAAVVTKMDVSIAGIAPTLGNFQASSPNFVVSVGKK